jgi:ankyrin repeat protein
VTPLHEAVASGQLKIARTLLACSTNVNAGDRTGWTALHTASSRGDIEMISLLLQFGAGTQCKTAEGHTPRDLAVQAGHKNAADLLDAPNNTFSKPPSSTATVAARRSAQREALVK